MTGAAFLLLSFARVVAVVVASAIGTGRAAAIGLVVSPV
jgi:hypothetical protein